MFGQAAIRRAEFDGRMRRRLWRLVAVVALLLAVLVPVTAPPAQADIIDLPIPQEGCLDSVADGVGMYENTVTPGAISLDVPGPVVQVIVEWVGSWQAAPTDPAIGLEVTGPSGTDSATFAGIQSAADPTGLASDAVIHAYYDDVTDLFGDGAAGSYSVDVTPPVDGVAGVFNTWWGATVTVVYDTAPCPEIAQMLWKIGADYYFGGGGGASPTTGLVVYEFDEPLAEALDVTVRMAHGGADASAVECRESNVWVATGTGTAPAETDDLVDADGNVVYPGAVEGVVDPFTPPSQPCSPPTVASPVTGVSGGNVGPEYALIAIDMTLPAGSTWLAFQLESPRDNNGSPGQPESGSWAGAGLIVIPTGTQPSISLEKTVLDGAGGACPGVEGTDELVVGPADTPVTYCFRVVNDGETALDPVVLDDPDLGITDGDMTLVSGDDTVPLPTGGELVYSYESTITGTLVNTATVTGTPVNDEGTPYGIPDVTDTNDAAVEEVPLPVPDVTLEKTVLDGAGGACPGAEGTDELVVGPPGTPVTYCFRVVNDGETALDPVVLDDPDLGITDGDMTLVSGDDTVPLPTGGELVYSYESTITADLVNTATVTGTPVDDQGGPIPGLDDVTDTNDAAVEIVVPPTPDVAIEKTVLEGPDGTCPGVNGTDELVTGEAGTPVTYCFRVENTGTTSLFPVTLDDPDLGVTDADMTLVSGDDSVPLAPGGVLVYSLESTIDASLVNVATVTGTPVDDVGDPIPDLPDVTDDDDAEVRELVLIVAVGPDCDNDTPYLNYSITADGLGTEATITFADGADSESVVVPVGDGRALWPGAVVDADGNPTDWPGWDLDADGVWYLNPDNPYAWARGDVQVTVEVNPIYGPVTVDYPPAEPTCSAQPPPPLTPPPPGTPPPPPGTPPPPPPPALPMTGMELGSLLWVALGLVALGLSMVVVGRSRGRGRRVGDTDSR